MIKYTNKGKYELYEEEGNKKIKGFIPYNSISSLRRWNGSDSFIYGCFSKTLADNADVKAIFNHNDEKILGRVKNNTLVLTDTAEGLYADLTLGNQSYAVDLYESLKRGDCDSISFGVEIINAKYSEDKKIRQITEARLFEISFGVTFPAFSDAKQSLYSEEETGIDYELALNSLFKEKMNKREEDNLSMLYEQVKNKIETFTANQNTMEPLKDTPIYSRDDEAIKRFYKLFN